MRQKVTLREVGLRDGLQIVRCIAGGTGWLPFCAERRAA